jgi:hypothetical protein
MAFDAYGETDARSLGIFFGALALAYLIAAFSNYFLRRPFVADAVLTVVIMTTLAFFIVAFFTRQNRPFGEVATVDWRLIPASVLILFALWILAGLALACSTRFEMIPTLAICSGVFLLGLMSDYLFGRLAEPVWASANLAAERDSPRPNGEQKKLLGEMVERYDINKDGQLNIEEQEKISDADKRRLGQAGLGGSWWASVLYTVVPNWQLFWLADALEGKGQIPWNYVGKAFVYVVGYLGAALALALLLFEDRELS